MTRPWTDRDSWIGVSSCYTLSRSMVSYLLIIASLLFVFGQTCEYGLPTPPQNQKYFDFPNKNVTILVDPPPLNVKPLIVNGPSSNRIDLVFFGDGYTQDEEALFYADALRLAQNITDGQTYYDVLPTLNFWAAFSPSKESGIGTGGKPKDTVYGLYRIGTELRGVYYDKPEVGHAACNSLGQQCDYPILLGNDPYYGGLGGTFTVITSSTLNGPLVLRHELGHSIIEEGDEYDGSYAYYGPNSASSPSSIPWEHWLNTPPTLPPLPRIEKSTMPLQEYPWVMLNTTSSWKIIFQSSGLYERYLVKFSLSGIPNASDFVVFLDGRDLGWVPDGDVGLDRWHYDIYGEEKGGGLVGGEHVLEFVLLNGDLEGHGEERGAQLCSVEVLEFGNEDEFISAPGHYSLYPTFSDKNETSYRPTNNECLMRRVTSTSFCSVCIEGLWLQLLRRVAFVDSVHQVCVGSGGGATIDNGDGRSASDGSTPANDNSILQINLDLIPLGQFRVIGRRREEDEKYTIKWYYYVSGGEERREFEEARDSSMLRLDAKEWSGTTLIEVEVSFESKQIRIEDVDGVLKQSVDIETQWKC